LIEKAPPSSRVPINSPSEIPSHPDQTNPAVIVPFPTANAPASGRTKPPVSGKVPAAAPAVGPAVAAEKAQAISAAPQSSAGAAPAPPSKPKTTKTAKSGGEFLPPKTVIQGYELERELGRGGMGAVYLAKQLSLDRRVALKVMSKKWASDPVFVARFTREAYAAAQLSHPNIVQIHDIGEAEGTRFFSMEYVRGRSLADVVRAQGKLDPEIAVGYVLQAARGLKHAHDRGMIHRDVKPDNLLLGEQGLVKVADLGLVKTPSTDPEDDLPAAGPRSGLHAMPANMTGARIALGTPAYMSPEQCRDAATVDHRADIYSLGCTLYVLVTGRPPFDGDTAMELMSKHAYDPLVPPEQIVSRVPKEISSVIQKMMEKNADDRFQTMDEVIRTLETWLGVSHAGRFSPREEQIEQLETAVRQFNSAPAAILRTRLITGFLAVAAISTLLILFFGRAVWAIGVVGMVVQASLAYFLIDGLTRRGFLFTRMKHFVLGMSWGDWGIGFAGFVLFGVVLAMLDLFWIWTGFGLVGATLAFLLRYVVDRKVEQQRAMPIEACEKLLRRLRMQGLDEEEIRQFVAKFSGRDWEEFFEAMFGYPAKLNARAVMLRGGVAGVREKHAAWREPLIALMDRIEEARRLAREQRLLREVERANLLAAGVTPEAAEDQAKVAAEAMVQAAVHVREVEAERVKTGNTGAAAAPLNVLQTVTAAEDNPFVPTSEPRNQGNRLIWLFVGPHVRALGAAVLLGACGLWADQNGLIPGSEARCQVLESRDTNAIQESVSATLRRSTQPLTVEGIPPMATAWINSWNVGVAGLLLFSSLFYRGNVMAVFAILGAGVVAVGHQLGINTVPPFRPEHISLLLGSVLALFGFRLGR
jgi:serine/threonine protein kinase